jgi:hypothetical protein
MKKVLVGCLVVIVIAMIGFGVAGFYAYRFVKPMVNNASSYLDKAREVSRLSDEIKIKTPYAPPANGELTAQQVERFLAVQSRVRSDLGGKWDEIEKKSAELKAKAQGSQSRDMTFSEFTSVFSDIANIWLDGRRSQVLALNTQRFSEEEYDWVRQRVYEAAGVELAGEIDFSKIQALAKENGNINVDIPKVDLPKVPENNLKLVKPYAAKVREWIPMAMLGF